MLFPAKWVYQGAASVRNWLYDARLIKASQVEAKVISVGNLTLGGTGKTPVTIALLDELKKRGLRCGVISRGYKRAQAGILEVDHRQKSAAHDFGDEPTLIKSTHPDIPVVVGKRRAQAAQALLASHQVDIILCDDAFQHRRLHRDLNLLLIDATEPLKNYQVVPVGRAREALIPALRRADILILTKSNLVEPEALSALSDWLEAKVIKPTLQAEYVFKGLRRLKNQVVEQSLKDPVYLISGVAKPQAVEKTLEGRVKLVKHRTFPDHHRYTAREVEEMLDEASRLQARWILTTAKDSMKLGAFPTLHERMWEIELGIQFKGEMKAFDEAIDRLARTGH